MEILQFVLALRVLRFVTKTNKVILITLRTELCNVLSFVVAILLSSGSDEALEVVIDWGGCIVWLRNRS